jgi:hypothetical protein
MLKCSNVNLRMDISCRLHQHDSSASSLLHAPTPMLAQISNGTVTLGKSSSATVLKTTEQELRTVAESAQRRLKFLMSRMTELPRTASAGSSPLPALLMLRTLTTYFSFQQQANQLRFGPTKHLVHWLLLACLLKFRIHRDYAGALASPDSELVPSPGTLYCVHCTFILHPNLLIQPYSGEARARWLGQQSLAQSHPSVGSRMCAT